MQTRKPIIEYWLRLRTSQGQLVGQEERRQAYDADEAQSHQAALALLGYVTVNMKVEDGVMIYIMERLTDG